MDVRRAEEPMHRGLGGLQNVLLWWALVRKESRAPWAARLLLQSKKTKKKGGKEVTVAAFGLMIMAGLAAWFYLDAQNRKGRDKR